MQESSAPQTTIKEIAKPKRHKVEIVLSDGSRSLLDDEILESEPVHVGDSIAHEHLRELVYLSEKAGIRRRALSLSARQRHTRKMLRDKLMKMTRDKKAIEETLDELTTLKLIDDSEFARDWILIRIKNHPEGKKNIYMGLLKRGIEREIAEGAIAELLPFEVEYEAAKDFLSRHRIHEDSSLRLTALLARSGFSRDVVKAVLSEQNDLEPE